MSDFEDESTSESEIEGDFSDSSEYAPEQRYQVRTDLNIQTLLPKKKQLIRMPQNVHYWLVKQPPHQVRNMLPYPQKFLRPKKYPQRAKSCTKNGCIKG